VAIFQVDVSRADEVAQMLADIAARLPPLRGIIHAAAILGDHELLELGAERLQAAMAPKLEGAWNLHAQTLSLPLDFFVLYSSAASLLGTAGQGGCAAGDAFLDALVHHRRGMGLCGMSIHWGPFAEASPAASS